MPQVFHVLQCYNCNIFQVDIVKKVPKWACKVCGEKQSVKKIHRQGSAKECRLHVQDLNKKKHKLEDEVCKEMEKEFNPQTIEQERSSSSTHEEKSKWLEFINETENEEDGCTSAIENSQRADRCSIKRKRSDEEIQGSRVSYSNVEKSKIVLNVPHHNQMFESLNDQDIDSFLEM